MGICEIPFSKEMAVAAIDGFKVCTTRREKKGELGDVFIIKDPRREIIYKFRIVDIKLCPLLYIAKVFHNQEGVSSEQDFETLWRKLHRGHYSTDNEYYVHWFARVD